MRDRLLGILLFLPVPLVLVLFTRAPLGVGPSLALGAVVMVSHRLYARPWTLRRAGRRCLWCGGEGGVEVIDVGEPGGPTRWAVHPGHRDPLARTLSAAAAQRLFLRVLILLALCVLVAFAAAGEHARGSALFRVLVAVAVLPLGGYGPRWSTVVASPPVPFPVHLQALIGTHAVLWLFRLVGLIWLVMGLSELLRT